MQHHRGGIQVLQSLRHGNAASGTWRRQRHRDRGTRRRRFVLPWPRDCSRRGQGDTAQVGMAAAEEDTAPRRAGEAPAEEGTRVVAPVEEAPQAGKALADARVLMKKGRPNTRGKKRCARGIEQPAREQPKSRRERRSTRGRRGMPSAQRWPKMQSGGPAIQNSDTKGHRYKICWRGVFGLLFVYLAISPNIQELLEML